jgi:GMP synthase (glutamine-hydrolysing)
MTNDGSPAGAGVTILKTGSTFAALARRAGDFEDWILSALGLPAERVRVIDARTVAALPPAARTGAVVVTGSPEMVTDEPAWSLAAAAWLRGLVENGVPVLGICYGHQLLARALGGDVGWSPRGREIGTVRVRVLESARHDALLGALPPRFPAYVSHSQTVLRLPPGAKRLARSEAEPNQAFRVGERAWGVQFHPEFSETVMRAYIEHHREELAAEGADANALLSAVAPSPAARLLGRFAELTGFPAARRDRPMAARGS